MQRGITQIGELFDEGRLDPADTVFLQIATPSRERVEEYRKLRDDLEAGFLGATPRDRGEFTRSAFAEAAEAERDWLERVRRLPDAKVPRLYGRVWREWDAWAGLP